ncbi:hypothetical protein C3941_00510 [Kaistia algarum]|uniref:hypothetical protein n=1 Tax=Kaistia algarum TaxID=2083279 RepID=UPI000CE8EDE9|nr:hypothetical protein [Kaistia algarum]MCX5513301.1 hypothetical protein [Kaistia algarum]PPE81245.1 hypothetical protein C3941_00510 [Kaistia algarum]
MGRDEEPAASAEKTPETAASRKERERAERLSAALRANLSRRKAARRAGLDDFGQPAPDDDSA